MKFRKILILSLALKFVITAAIFILAHSVNAAATSIDPSFKQVKSADSSTVYYIDHARGLKKAYTSESAYLAYGNKWSDVRIVAQDDLGLLPDVSLVKIKDDPKIYYIKDGQKAWIQTESEFIKYGFRWSDVVSILPADLKTYQDSYLELIYSPDTSETIATADYGDSSLSIKVDELSPESKMIPLNTANNLIGIFKLSSVNSSIEIKEIKIKLLGLFDRNLLEGAEITTGTSLTAKTANGQNSELKFYFNKPLLINAGSSKTVNLYVDISDSNQDVSNQTIQASLSSVTILDSGEENIITPYIKADEHTLVDGSGVLAGVSTTEQISNLNNQELAVGTTDQKIIKFEIKENTDVENVLIKKIVLVNSGSASEDDLSNFILRDRNNKNITSAQQMNDQTLVFYLDNYEIKKGSNETFTVTANIDGGDQATINMQIQEVIAQGKEYGCNASSNIINTNEIIKISRKSLGVLSLKLTPSNGVFSEQSGVLLGVYEIRNNNKTIDLENMKVELHRSDSAPTLKGSVVLVNYKTGELISAINNNGTVYSFDISGINLHEKDEIKLAVISEIPESAKQGDRYYLTLNSLSYRSQNGGFYSEDVNVNSQTLVVSRSNIFIYNDNEVSGTYYSKGEKKVEVAKFYIETSYGDDARVTSLTFTKGNTSGSVSYDNGFSNVRAYIGNRQVGEVIAQPYTDTFYFGGFETKLSDARRYEITLVADTEKDLNVSETQYRLANITAASYTSGINAIVAGLNTDSKPVYFGSPQVELTAESGGQVIIGEKSNMIGSFNVTNTGDEEVRLDYITLITSNEGFSYSQGYDDLKIIDSETGRTLSIIRKPTSGANRIYMRRLKLEKGVTKTFNIYVDAEKVVDIGEFQLYFAELEAESEHSGIEAQVKGCPSQDVKVVVN